MTEDFKQTATTQGNIQRQQLSGIVKALQATATTSTDQTEIMNALLMLERMGETIG
ncbi:hypothetical protein Lepto7375DRAFT_7419 [Leptolyngbya sp. PCC 7375]|nr:hypothetical protein Lepto7375DRAFT_7419 [Leptolyngbya sp. PCC 7375]